MKVKTKKRMFCGSTQLVVSSPLLNSDQVPEFCFFDNADQNEHHYPLDQKNCDQKLEKFWCPKKMRGQILKVWNICYKVENGTVPQNRKSLYIASSDKSILKGETPKIRWKLIKERKIGIVKLVLNNREDIVLQM